MHSPAKAVSDVVFRLLRLWHGGRGEGEEGACFVRRFRDDLDTLEEDRRPIMSSGAPRDSRRPTLVDYGIPGQLAGWAWSTRMAGLSVPAGKK